MSVSGFLTKQKKEIKGRFDSPGGQAKRKELSKGFSSTLNLLRR